MSEIKLSKGSIGSVSIDIKNVQSTLENTGDTDSLIAYVCYHPIYDNHEICSTGDIIHVFNVPH